ncbi:minor tail protein [Mycobacterium phage Heffalump]|uniref:Minor tail protein n=1 Tax=Mycobacterium phage Heffalump TaxID=1983575 RepID=A0A220NSE9_9CAUD|nr:minor tail protein [Mycobacterium phage Heffalump]ASJ79730.1 minor tail protein [Mycobacterium phage Heffalump]
MQYPTTPLEAIGADGAFQIGGGDFDFGQGYTENLIKDLFEVPLPTSGQAIEVLTQQLKRLPLDALKTFKEMIPGTIDDDFIDVTTAVATIIGNLASLPKALLSGDFDEWVAGAFQSISTEVKQILEILGGLIVTPINEAVQAVKDWFAGITGQLSHIGSDGKINAPVDQIPALQDLVDNVTNALSGASQVGSEIVGAGLDNAKHTMENLFAMLTKTVRDVQALQSEQESTANGGRRFNIDFSAYPDGAFPSGLFNITYSGPGTSTLGINNGHAVWNTVNNGYRRATMIYPTPTLTPQQIVRGTLSSPPAQGTNVRIWSIARSNAAGTDYVFARGYCTGFLSYKGDIGCVVNGVEQVWVSGISLTWNLDLRVVCGVGENPRRHQVYSGNTVVLDLVEPGNKQSVIDENHCYWGAITETDGKNVPGNVAGASVSDNAPPAVTGSTMRVYRSLTSATSDKSGGEQILPANSLDAVDYRSEDITWDAATQTATVTKSGTYMIGLRVETNDTPGFSEEWYPLLYINGVPRVRMGARRGISINGFGVPSVPQDRSVGGDGVTYYLPAGATVRPGLKTDKSMGIVGDANASKSWMTLAKVG